MMQGHLQGRGRGAEEMLGILSKEGPITLPFLNMQRDTQHKELHLQHKQTVTLTHWATN